MLLDKVERIFLSSASGGLQDCRVAARDAINRLDWAKCVGMEDFGANPNLPSEVCIEKLRSCSVFVGIVGPRYGSIAETGESYCELEYNHAVKAGIPRLLFLSERNFPFPAELIGNDADRTRQEQFRNRASSESTVKYFVSPESLPSAVTESLASFKIGLLASRLPSTREHAGEKTVEHTFFSEPQIGSSSLDDNPSEVKVRLLFPFATNQAGFDSGISVANTSAEPFGKDPTSGSITIHYFGGTTGGGLAPPPQTSSKVLPGSLALFTLSGGGNLGIAATPGFQGYIVIECRFPDAEGFGFVSDVGANKVASGYLANRL